MEERMREEETERNDGQNGGLQKQVEEILRRDRRKASPMLIILSNGVSEERLRHRG